MGDKRGFKFSIFLIINIILVYLANIFPGVITSYDLGLIVTKLYITFPVAALISGILGGVLGSKALDAFISNALAFCIVYLLVNTGIKISPIMFIYILMYSVICLTVTIIISTIKTKLKGNK